MCAFGKNFVDTPHLPSVGGSGLERILVAKHARATLEVEEPPVQQKKGETKAEFVQSMALVLAVGLFIITFCLQAFEIPSSSMEDTLLIGDHVFVDRITYAPPTKWLGPVVPYRDIKRGITNGFCDDPLLVPLLEFNQDGILPLPTAANNRDEC